jgi:hypothetical protein
MKPATAVHVWANTAAILIAALLLTACGESSRPQDAARSDGPGPTQSPRSPQVLTRVLNRAPLFESQQTWSAGYLRAIGNGPGVVVGPGPGNPNVFAQQFLAAPDEPFKVVARASSVGSAKATGRIQINWNNAAGTYISVSSTAFEVSSVEGRFEFNATAPPGTATGTLYVVADGPTSVVRYTEMTLLGAREAGGRTNRTSDAVAPVSPGIVQSAVSDVGSSGNAFPRPPNLTPLDGSGRALTAAESQYYFYHATKAMQRKARERGMDFIMYVMPDPNISRLLPAISQLRAEGIKVLAYEPQGAWPSGVDWNWYWQWADSHWREAAVRLTADEMLRMWETQTVSNRPFSTELMNEYAHGFPKNATRLASGKAGAHDTQPQ